MYSLEMWIATFRLLTASLLQAMRSTDYAAPFISRSAVIGACRSSIVPACSSYLSGPLLYRSTVVVFLIMSIHASGIFNSAMPVDVIRMKFYEENGTTANR